MPVLLDLGSVLRSYLMVHQFVVLLILVATSGFGSGSGSCVRSGLFTKPGYRTVRACLGST
jgi:hypothetical protein